MHHSSTEQRSYILLLSALRQEMLPLLSGAQNFDEAELRRTSRTTLTLFGKPLLCLCSGMGHQAAKLALEEAASRYRIESALLWGSAASIRGHIAVGDFCVADFTRLGDSSSAPLRSCAGTLSKEILGHAETAFAKVHRAGFLCVEAPVFSSAQIAKDALRSCEVADMESWALADFAQERGIPFAITKVISDVVDAPRDESCMTIVQSRAAQYLDLLRSVFA